MRPASIDSAVKFPDRIPRPAVKQTGNDPLAVEMGESRSATIAGFCSASRYVACVGREETAASNLLRPLGWPQNDP
jgi:hypothetical protein